jgi:hypothetical protein
MLKFKEKYYDYVLEDFKVSKEEEIIFSILQDFTNRRGLRQQWEEIDDNIQEEIIENWINIVKNKLNEL